VAYYIRIIIWSPSTKTGSDPRTETIFPDYDMNTSHEGKYSNELDMRQEPFLINIRKIISSYNNIFLS
jgi:hypothetical protein